MVLVLVGSLGVGLKDLVLKRPPTVLESDLHVKKKNDLRLPSQINGSFVCNDMSHPFALGRLDPLLFPEISGMAQSWTFPYSLYVMNDAEEGNKIHQLFLDSSPDGKYTIKKIKTYVLNLPKAAKNPEAMAVGPCPDRGSCIFLADVGDNKLQRSSYQIFILREPTTKEDLFENNSMEFLGKISFVYPDGQSHNGESFAVDPKTGDFYFFTKESSNIEKDEDHKKKILPPATFYKISYQQWLHFWKQSFVEKISPLVSEKRGELDMYELTQDKKWRHQVITSLDIRPDGKAIILLTYDKAYEWVGSFDRIGDKLINTRSGYYTWKKISVVPLPQQEAITYFYDPYRQSMSIFYTTESKKHPFPVIGWPCTFTSSPQE